MIVRCGPASQSMQTQYRGGRTRVCFPVKWRTCECAAAVAGRAPRRSPVGRFSAISVQTHTRHDTLLRYRSGRTRFTNDSIPPYPPPLTLPHISSHVPGIREISSTRNLTETGFICFWIRRFFLFFFYCRHGREGLGRLGRANPWLK